MVFSIVPQRASQGIVGCPEASPICVQRMVAATMQMMPRQNIPPMLIFLDKGIWREKIRRIGRAMTGVWSAEAL